MPEVEVPQEAVEAVLNHRWGADDPRSEHARHGYDEDCAVCQENVPAMLAVAAPLLLAHYLRVIGDEMRDVPAWLAERRISDSASPGYVLASVRAALYATADGLDAPDAGLGVQVGPVGVISQVEAGVQLSEEAARIAATALRRAAVEHQPEGMVLGAPCVVCRSTGWPCRASVDLNQRAAELVPPVEDTPDGLLAALGCPPDASLLVKAARWHRREGREPSAEWARMAEAYLRALPDQPASAADQLVKDALFLCQHGERPPGAPSDPAGETWADWDRRVEEWLREAVVPDGP